MNKGRKRRAIAPSVGLFQVRLRTVAVPEARARLQKALALLLAGLSGEKDPKGLGSTELARKEDCHESSP